MASMVGGPVGPFWLGTSRTPSMDEWVQPFGARDESAARATLEALGKADLELRGPFNLREAYTALDAWLERDERAT